MGGENIELLLPQVLVNQLHHVKQMMQTSLADFAKDKSEDYMKKFNEEKMPEIFAGITKVLTDNYISARDEVQKDADTMKEFFRSQREMPGKTKADVLKELWAELPKHMDSPVPPLDEEMLAELAQEPASEEGELLHNWGTADKLYKSEAIDSFGSKYLLGIFETKEDASKAFDAWNAEYEAARKTLDEELAQWSKQEQARQDKDVEGQERIKKV